MASGTTGTKLICVAVCLGLWCTTRQVASSLSGTSAIVVNENGYDNVAVAIKPGVTPNNELIEKIKLMFSEASVLLYRATHHRLFFRNVTIFVPKTWPHHSSYHSQSKLVYANSDVVIESSSGRSASPPYTRQHRGCGKEGSNVNFMDSFLLDPNLRNNYASLGHILLHEWGHYRWGLFDEIPTDVNDHFFFSSLTKQFEGSRCSANITGNSMKLDGISQRECYGNSSVGYEVDCRFVPTESQHEATSSVMYGLGKYDTITDFCDSDPTNVSTLHNHEASNQHNRLCDRQSNWDVMKKHTDLKDGSNPPREFRDESELLPTFNIVQQNDSKLVLLLETSRQMLGEPLERMMSAVTAFIMQEAPIGASIAIMRYHNVADRLIDGFVRIQSDEDRHTLVSVLPTHTYGATSVGDALFKATVMLEDYSVDTTGDRILIINANAGNQFPSIDYTKSKVLSANVIVDAVVITQNAEPELFTITELTGGTVYYDTPDSGSVGSMVEAMKRSLDRYDVSDDEKRFQVLGASLTVLPEGSEEKLVYIDSTIGRDTRFAVSWILDSPVVAPVVTLIDPSGSSLTDSYPGYSNNTELGLSSYHVQGHALEGPWKVVIGNSDASRSVEIHLSVTSATINPDVPPITLTSAMNELSNNFQVTNEPLTIYAEVKQGYRAVVNADVTALVSIPKLLDPVEVRLLDNGAGADITKHDGIYSGCFTNYTVDGLYGVGLKVENDGAAELIDFPASLSPPRTVGSDSNSAQSESTLQRLRARAVGNPAPIFKRLVSAGAIRMTGVPPNGTDELPPGKITDLRVVGTSYKDKTVELEWTATGDDFDSGKAKLYELTRGANVDAFLAGTGTVPILQSDIKYGNLVDPKPSGSTETFTVLVPIDAGVSSFAFSVAAEDDVGLKSPPSNVVFVTVREYIPTAPFPTTPAQDASSPMTTEPTVTISIPYTTVKPILTRTEVIVIGVISSAGILSAIIISAVSITKYLLNSKVVPSRPVSKASIDSTRRFLDKKDWEGGSMKIVDLEAQGMESEI
ncbi:calcium-activated chloride channel regulator 1-like [Asterias rubens]|uniref:calcium-activated chloride channel regulator 1-like n=1 Tax=Asterias rubens TaxID=7604 RepID=UPI001455573D|nr:calcium-activated chloride channel regulator 1-like [Asterias rubens]